MNECCKTVRRELRTLKVDHQAVSADAARLRAGAETFEADLVARIAKWLREKEADFVDGRVIAALEAGAWRKS